MTKLQIYMGTDNFAKMRSIADNLYVDKSLLVQEFLRSREDVALILRPRRFGKTLNLSMLCEFFSNRRGGAPNLFTGLKISEDTVFCTAHQNKYPVIFISLKGLETLSLDALLSAVNNLVAHLFSSFTAECRAVIQQFRESHVDVTKIELDFTALVEGRAGQQQLETSLKFLCQCLELYYNQKVIILIDEYDAVLNFAWRNYCREKISYHKDGKEMPSEERRNWERKIREINTFIRHFLGSALKGNDHLFKGLMTGIYPMAKRDSASDLNNVRVFSLLNERYSNFFGFTDGELDWILKVTESPMSCGELKSWYDGYQAGANKTDRLYNPWSVLTCLQEGKMHAYWEETGNHDLIHDKVLAFLMQQ